MPNKVPVTQKVKQKAPVTPANTAKFTDLKKKAAKIQAGPGVSLAAKGTTMRTAQDANAKAKAEAYKKKYGVYPTPANVKKYGKS